MGSDSRPVCYRCAQIKQACDGSLPCARCIRLSLPCRPRDPAGNGGSIGPGGSGINGAGGDFSGPDIPKARIRRVQTGCLMCKRRKKKCDETKPRCGDCRRLCLDCSWPAERPKEKASSSAAAAAARAKARAGAAPTSAVLTLPPTSAPTASMLTSPPLEFPSPDIGQKPSCSSQSPLSPPSPASPLQSPSSSASPLPQFLLGSPDEVEIAFRDSLSPNLSPSRTGLGGYTVADYIINDQHHIPNDAGSAISRPNHLNAFEAMDSFLTNGAGAMDLEFSDAAAAADRPRYEFEPPAQLSSMSSSSSSVFNDHIGFDTYHTPASYDSPRESVDSGTMASLSIYVPRAVPQLSNSQDRALLNHYTAIVSTILSRRTSTSNPYNNYLLPLAQSNDTILHCVLALSASHWRKLQPQLADRGIYHQSKATQSLARLLPHVSRANVDIALVSCLLLCMTELFDGTSEGWKLHLKGAKKLLTTLINQQGNSAAEGHKFLLRLAKFLDSAATVSTCRPPLIGEDEREAATLDRLTALPDEDDSAVYGIPKELFHLVDVINTLAEKRKDRVDSLSEAAFRMEAAKVEERINNWSNQPAEALSPPSTGTAVRSASAPAGRNNFRDTRPPGDDVSYATVAYEHALRLRLHQIVEGYAIDDSVTAHVDAILEAVQAIRYGSPLEACLLFPLVMAGGACSSMEHRCVIFDRLMIMERTCGFGYIYNARDLVQRVWNMRDQTEGTGVEVNWARIRYEEMHGLVVF